MAAYACGGGAGDWYLGWLLKTSVDGGFGGPRGPRGRRGPWQGQRGRGRCWGPPGGEARGGGQRRHRGPRARGDVRSAVPALLADEPMHGYQLVPEIGRRGGGTWKPSPGSAYPTLQQLVDEGLVRAQEQDGRRVYLLTDEGQRVATDRAEDFATLWEGVAPSEDGNQLGDLIFQVGAAFVPVARTGTAEQMAQARAVLARTRADLYRILAGQGAHADRSGRS